VRTLKFVAVDDGELVFHDVVDDNFTEYVIDDQHTGSLTVEMVKRAPRRKRQDFKAGDVLAGEEMVKVWWKRGTIFHFARLDKDRGLVLREDGKLYALSNVGSVLGREVYEFDNLNHAGKFVIDYLP
jgi:hypothetical protein